MPSPPQSCRKASRSGFPLSFLWWYLGRTMADLKQSAQDKAQQQQHDAVIQAHHISQRRHAHDQIYQARDYAIEKAGLSNAQIAVIVIDSDDPWMDDATYEKLGGYGYSVQVTQIERLSERLKTFSMPSARSGLQFEHSSRSWVDDKGKAVTDYATQRPYLKESRSVLEPLPEGFFLVVTFTKNSVAMHEMPEVKWRLEDEDKPAQAEAHAEASIEAQIEASAEAAAESPAEEPPTL